MPSEKRGRGRPPKDPQERRDKIVAVRFRADEWSRGLGFEIRYAANAGVRASPSELIRKAVRFYVARRDLKNDPEYPQPKTRRKAQ
jgi:hypothetical protein